MCASQARYRNILMCRRLPTALLIAATMASSAHGATEDLLVYNELEQNGFSHLSSQYSAGQVNYASLVLPHTGLYSVRADNHPASVAVASWAAPAAYSTLSDYDGISFWIFGPDGSEAIDLVLYSGDDLVGYASVADMYGAPIPAAPPRRRATHRMPARGRTGSGCWR